MSAVSGQKGYRKHKFIPESIVNILAKEEGVMMHSLKLKSAYDHSKHQFISSFMIDFAGNERENVFVLK